MVSKQKRDWADYQKARREAILNHEVQLSKKFASDQKQKLKSHLSDQEQIAEQQARLKSLTERKISVLEIKELSLVNRLKNTQATRDKALADLGAKSEQVIKSF